jgi:hypothetical protein
LPWNFLKQGKGAFANIIVCQTGAFSASAEPCESNYCLPNISVCVTEFCTACDYSDIFRREQL